MAQRFELEPCDEAFFGTAPQRHTGVFEIARPAAAVWAELTRDRALEFCRLLTGAEWTSPRPFGAGTTRTMGVGWGALWVDETFFVWEEEPPRWRKAFYLTSSSLPLFRRLAEDYAVQETGPQSCRFTWTLAGEPLPLTRAGAPLTALLARSLFANTRRHFDAA